MPLDDQPPYEDSLTRLAERVARNREVLGLHYPSDSVAGKYIAAMTLPILLECRTVQWLLENAVVEWTNDVAYP
jgi:hypothetical protein